MRWGIHCLISIHVFSFILSMAIQDATGRLRSPNTYLQKWGGSLVLQYAIGTWAEGWWCEVVKISYHDNTYPLDNKKDIAQLLYSAVVEFSHYHRHPSTKNKDYQKSNPRGTIGTMKEHRLSSNQ